MSMQKVMYMCKLKKIKILLMLILLAIPVYIILDVKSDQLGRVESYTIPTGFNFIAIPGDVREVELSHEGKIIDTIDVKNVLIGENSTAGVDLPALWSGRYDILWESPSRGLKGFFGVKEQVKYELTVGGPEKVNAMTKCLDYGTTAEGNGCLAEYLPRLIKEIGAKATRDEIVKLSDDPLIWYCHGWLGGYAMGVLKEIGFEKALNSDYLTCKYTYLHYLVANQVLLERDLGSVIDYCIKDKFIGMEDTEAVFQCAHGVGFAGIASLRLEADIMLDICNNFRDKIGYAVTNCYEGVYRAKEMKAKSYHNFKTDFRPISIDPSTFTYLDKPESCIGKNIEYKHACYRYTMRGNTTEAEYAMDISKRVEYIYKWRDEICRVDTTDACWYGLADVTFNLLGSPPFWAMEYLPKEHWEAAVLACSEDEDSFNKTCIERITHDHINKTLDKKLLSEWCSFLATNTDQKCVEASIDAYIKRFKTGKLYDPQAIKLDHEAEKTIR